MTHKECFSHEKHDIYSNFKKFEMFSVIYAPPDTPCIVRCDGRNFHRLTDEVGFSKPYDLKFMKIMVESAKAVFKEGFNPILAYIFSDEINFLFRDLPFNRRVEKIDSILASIVSSAFSLKLLESMSIRKIISFDARIVPLPEELVPAYFIWRQSECWRNLLNSYAFYSLLKLGYSKRKAANTLKGMKSDKLHEIIFKTSGINPARTPLWQRRGVMLHYVKVIRRALDKRTGEEVLCTRKVLVENWNVPLFSSEPGRKFLEKIIRIL
ncbi:MAG: tRNA(His) guanylyltransferase Thg1 family protein [Candidatus Baldrarchaeia archaeon]